MEKLLSSLVVCSSSRCTRNVKQGNSGNSIYKPVGISTRGEFGTFLVYSIMREFVSGRFKSRRGKGASLAPMFEPEVFRKQMYCVETSTCDMVRTFRRPPQSFAARRIVLPSLRPWFVLLYLCWLKVTNNDIVIRKYLNGRPPFLKEEKIQCVWRYRNKNGPTITTLWCSVTVQPLNHHIDFRCNKNINQKLWFNSSWLFFAINCHKSLQLYMLSLEKLTWSKTPYSLRWSVAKTLFRRQNTS